MTKDELYGVVRVFLAAAGGFAVNHGWIDSDTALALSGAMATVIVATWSVRSKRKGKKESNNGV